MPEIEQRLLRCFAAVFPGVPEADLRRATPDRLSAWDSVANVMVVAVVEQEFGVQIPLDGLETLNSFDAIRSFLANRTASA